ncbi:uncharacterized protein LOC133188362 [Saccostrea echinata]|uniref:uncharacterized protein LOC133188362 n=1 Tax=Saccostrea echinata TaxID=191078 RepID=UPI002A81D60B|nr:uncharacterized protein LOC133188362 [Saccostrea echinata]
MERVVYQQPMDDGGQEHHPMLLNDGREVPKLPQPDLTIYGNDLSYFTLLRQQLSNSSHQKHHGFIHSNQQPQKIKLNVSKATRVLEPPPSPDEVILIDSDEEDDSTSSKINFPKEFKDLQMESSIQLNQTVDSSAWTHPTSPAPRCVPVQKKKLRMSTKLVADEEDQGCDLKLKHEDIKTMVVDPTPEPQTIDTGQLGIQMRTGGIDDLNEILELMHEIGEIPKVKERKISFEEGKVVDGEKEALVELLNTQEKLKNGTTGVICQRLESSRYEEYNEGHFTVLKQLGEGSYGTVDLCKDSATEEQFVLKKVQKDFKVEEVVVLLYLEHENITALYGYIKRDGISEILMEYAGMNLLNFVLKKQTMEEQVIWNITRQALSALKYLDQHQVKHLDLKPENICVTDNMVVKLTDFGSAKMAMQEQDYQGWTSEYMAPEMCRSFLKSRYPNVFKDEKEDFSLTGKVDVFAFGLVVQFMLERAHTQTKFYTDGANSYKDVKDVNQLRLQIIIANAKDPDMILKLMLTEKGSVGIRELLRGLLQGVPKNRLSAEQALLKIEAMERKHMIPGLPPPETKDDTVSTKLASFHRRRSTARQLSTLASISSNTSQIEEPLSPGPVKGRRKGRKRICPYDFDDNNKPIAVDENLLGNVPDFSVLQA